MKIIPELAPNPALTTRLSPALVAPKAVSPKPAVILVISAAILVLLITQTASPDGRSIGTIVSVFGMTLLSAFIVSNLIDFDGTIVLDPGRPLSLFGLFFLLYWTFPFLAYIVMNRLDGAREL